MGTNIDGKLDEILSKLDNVETPQLIETMPCIYIAMHWMTNQNPMWSAYNTEYIEYIGNVIKILVPGTYKIDIRCNGYGGTSGGCSAYLGGSRVCRAAGSGGTTTGTYTFTLEENNYAQVTFSVGASSALTTGCIKITKIEDS